MSDYRQEGTGKVITEDEIREVAQSTGCPFTLFEDYMTDEEVQELRLSTDILIFAPVSDAFSATVTQAFAAESAVIAGAWLPYKTRKMTGFQYEEIHQLEKAGPMLAQLIERWDEELVKIKDNKVLVGEIFSEKAIGSGWLTAYETAIANFKDLNN
jgi:hypothetical protein